MVVAKIYAQTLRLKLKAARYFPHPGRRRPRGFLWGLWAFYLSTSEAGFRERRIGDVQALFAKPRYFGA